MDVRAYNREKWDKQVENGNPWTIPVSPESDRGSAEGEWSVLLTEQKSSAARLVPRGPARGGHPVPGIGRRAARSSAGSRGGERHRV